MNRPAINEKEYIHWAKNKYVEYASCSISDKKGKTNRLVFSVSLVGIFKVTLGSDVLYLGESFYLAADRFESAN